LENPFPAPVGGVPDRVGRDGGYLVWPLAFAAASDRRRLLLATCAVGASYAIGHAPLA
jgi:hypothetical protein